MVYPLSQHASHQQGKGRKNRDNIGRKFGFGNRKKEDKDDDPPPKVEGSILFPSLSGISMTVECHLGKEARPWKEGKEED